MKAFDPIKLHIVGSEQVSHLYTTHPMLVGGEDALEIGSVVAQHVWRQPDADAMFIWIKVLMRAQDSAGRERALTDAVYRVMFIVDDLDDVVEFQDDTQQNLVETNAMIAMLSVAVSTVRGQLEAANARTVFRRAILPVMTVDQIVNLPHFDFKRDFDYWLSGDQQGNSSDEAAATVNSSTDATPG